MDNNFSIGNRIRELRNQKHLSQEQLALSAEITTAYLGQIPQNELDSLTLQILYLVKNENDEVKQIILQMIKQALKLKRER